MPTIIINRLVAAYLAMSLFILAGASDLMHDKHESSIVSFCAAIWAGLFIKERMEKNK